MNELEQVPQIPLWAVFFGTFLLVVLSILIGYRIGAYYRKRYGEKEEGPIGSVVGATLGLLAFLLAFTFGLSANRFDTRVQLVRDEANAIRTAWERSDFLPEPDRGTAKAVRIGHEEQ